MNKNQFSRITHSKSETSIGAKCKLAIKRARFSHNEINRIGFSSREKRSENSIRRASNASFPGCLFSSGCHFRMVDPWKCWAKIAVLHCSVWRFVVCGLRKRGFFGVFLFLIVLLCFGGVFPYFWLVIMFFFWDGERIFAYVGFDSAIYVSCIKIIY